MKRLKMAIVAALLILMAAGGYVTAASTYSNYFAPTTGGSLDNVLYIGGTSHVLSGGYLYIDSGGYLTVNGELDLSGSSGVTLVDSVALDGDKMVWEGDTADAYELTFEISEPAADKTLYFKAANDAAVVLSTLTTNDVDAANSVWFASNSMVWEMTTANDYELTVQPLSDGAAADVTVKIPSLTNATLAVSTLTTNDVDVANSIWLASGGIVGEGSSADANELTLSWPNTASSDKTVSIPDATGTILLDTNIESQVLADDCPFVLEGDTDDAYETTICVSEPLADKTILIPSANDVAVVVSTLTTNDVDAANGIWLGTNSLIWEMATANDYEVTMQPLSDGAAADVTVKFPSLTAGTLVLSTLTTNDVDVASSVWLGTSSIIFEGSTADANELTVTIGAVSADRTATLPDASGTFILSTAAQQAAGAIWAAASSLVFEGASADDYETTLTVADPTADQTVTIPNASGGVNLTLKKDTTIAQINDTTAVAGSTLVFNLPDAGNQFLHVMCGGTINTDDQGSKEVALLGGATVVTTFTIAQADDGEYLFEAWVGALSGATVVAGGRFDCTANAGTAKIDTNAAGTALDISVPMTWTVQMDLAHADDEMSMHWCIWELKP